MKLISDEKFRKLHEDFFGKGSCDASEIDDSDLCYRVAQAQLTADEKDAAENYITRDKYYKVVETNRQRQRIIDNSIPKEEHKKVVGEIFDCMERTLLNKALQGKHQAERDEIFKIFDYAKQEILRSR